MQKFRWRLQRLLDVRQKQHEALRAELIALTEQAAALRGRILMEKAMLRSRLAELRALPAERRLRQQQDFMAHISAVDGRIAALEQQLNELEQKRKEKTKAVMTARKSCRMLERLRENAVEAYQRGVRAEERKLEDESTTAAVARRMLEIN
jgi:flagellar biosynthesis chaperone FliJ